MKYKLISYLLFSLFCVVIAFPGYGMGNKRSCAQKHALKATDRVRSLEEVLKKCLSSGINMIEEERVSEEDEHSHAGISFLASHYASPGLFVTRSSISFYEDHPGVTPGLKTIFSPPEPGKSL